MGSSDEDEDFTPLVTQDPSAWDDTALIQAFERATKSHTLAVKGAAASNAGFPHGSKKRQRLDAVTQPSSSPSSAPPPSQQVQPPPKSPPKLAPQQPSPSLPPLPPTPQRQRQPHPLQQAKRAALQIPAPPAPQLGISDRELEQLLQAWYEAGYRAGAYAARHGGAM